MHVLVLSFAYIIYECISFMKVKKKTKKRISLFSKIIILLFGMWVLWGIWILGLNELFPYTKRNFVSYEDFLDKTDNYYPDVQPASADEIQYYYYEGKFDDFSAVAFTVDAEDFERLSERYIEWFEKDHGSCDVRYENQALSENFIKEENLDFLKDMMDGDCSDYIIVEYMGSGNSEIKTMEGAIGNVSTGRFIIFSCRDAFPE